MSLSFLNFRYRRLVGMVSLMRRGLKLFYHLIHGPDFFYVGMVSLMRRGLKLTSNPGPNKSEEIGWNGIPDEKGIET